MSRESAIYTAKLAEDCERYDDMIIFVKEIIDSTNGNLDSHERALFSAAYMIAISQKTVALRILRKNFLTLSSENIILLQEYNKIITQEIRVLCFEVVNLIDTKLLKEETSYELQAIYLKMKANYLGKIVEIGGVEEIQQCFDSYMHASAIAKNLPAINCTRLSIDLDFSIYLQEYKNDVAKACEVAKNSLEESTPMLTQLNEHDCKDASFILKLIEANLRNWESLDLDMDMDR